MYNDYDNNRLRFTDWKVFIDNTSEWFDRINRAYAKCYEDIKIIQPLFAEMIAFVTSRRANLYNFDDIMEEVSKVKTIIYSKEYKELQEEGVGGKLHMRILEHIDQILGKVSLGLSHGDLIPKYDKKEELPYEVTGTFMDNLNKAVYDMNKTTVKNEETKD